VEATILRRYKRSKHKRHSLQVSTLLTYLCCVQINLKLCYEAVSALAVGLELLGVVIKDFDPTGFIVK